MPLIPSAETEYLRQLILLLQIFFLWFFDLLCSFTSRVISSAEGVQQETPFFSVSPSFLTSEFCSVFCRQFLWLAAQLRDLSVVWKGLKHCRVLLCQFHVCRDSAFLLSTKIYLLTYQKQSMSSPVATHGEWNCKTCYVTSSWQFLDCLLNIIMT